MDNVFRRFPVLELDTVVLRELRRSDAQDYYDYLSDPMVNRYVSEEDTPKTPEAAVDEVKYWSDLFLYKRSIYWAIADKKSDRLIGTCGFNAWSITHARVEISYDLARAFWNRGIMTEALGGVCDFGFGVMGINRVQATVACDNIGSHKVLKKLGFLEESILREYGILHGVKKDFYMMSLLQKDLTF